MSRTVPEARDEQAWLLCTSGCVHTRPKSKCLVHAICKNSMTHGAWVIRYYVSSLLARHGTRHRDAALSLRQLCLKSYLAYLYYLYSKDPS